MREIKFRGYQKNTKRLLPVVNIGFNANGVVESVSVDNNGCYGEYNVIPRLSTFYKGRDVYNLELLDLMQFTGVYDNTKWENLSPAEQDYYISMYGSKLKYRGREIYDGDIIELEYKNKRKRLQISFSQEHQCLILLYLDEPKVQDKYTYDKFDKSWWEYNCKNERITIIGNIHFTQNYKNTLKL